MDTVESSKRRTYEKVPSRSYNYPERCTQGVQNRLGEEHGNSPGWQENEKEIKVKTLYGNFWTTSRRITFTL